MAFDLSQNFVSVQYLELLILTRSMLGLLAVTFRKNVRELWPLIDVRISLNILRNYGLFLHTKHCSGAIVKFSDNSSFNLTTEIDEWVNISQIEHTCKRQSIYKKI